MARRSGRVSPQKLAHAGSLLDAGVSQRQVSKRTGISPDTLRRHFGRKRQAGAAPDKPSRAPDDTQREQGAPVSSPPGRAPDPPPIPGGHADAKGPPTGDQLEVMLRRILKAASVPMRLRCDYCADHMQRTAARTAAQALKDEDLRKSLEWLFAHWQRYEGYGVIAMWLGIPALHHLTPDPVFKLVAPAVGLPDRQNGHRHTPRRRRQPDTVSKPAARAQPVSPDTTSNGAPAPVPDDIAADVLAATAGTPGAGGPFDGLDLDQLLAVAGRMGIQVPPEVLAEAATLGARVPDTLSGDDAPTPTSADPASIPTVPESGLPPDFTPTPQAAPPPANQDAGEPPA